MALRRVPTTIHPVRQSSVPKAEECDVGAPIIPEETITVKTITTKGKHKGGRPKSKNKRRHQVKLSLDDASLSALKKLKEESGKNASELFVDFLHGAKIKPVKALSKEDLDHYKELAFQARRLGIVTNQYVRLLNNQGDPLSEQLRSLNTQIQQEANQLRKKLW